MRYQFSLPFLCVIFLLSCSFSKSIPGGQQQGGAVVVSANEFLNSIGVNAAVSRRGESLDKTIEITQYLGIRWIRSGYEGGLPVEDLLTLHDKNGIKFSYGLLSGGNDIPLLLKGARKLASTGALLAIEGPNEPNNWSITYNGEKGGGNSTWLPVAKLQKDLYLSVKRDPVLKDYPVWSLTENGAETDNAGLQFLQIPQGAGTLMPDGTAYADYANCHNYFMHPSHPGLYDNQTWNAADPTQGCKVDGLYGNYGNTWRSHFPGYTEKELLTLPRVTTESGAVINGKLTEEKQARLYLNLYLSQFKRGWRYTAIYLLRDRSDEAGNQQFGFYKADYTPRKAAIYLHNLTTILADNGSVKKWKRLRYTIPGKPETVHDLLLQKSNGTFELVIWDERVEGDDEIKVHLGEAFKQANIYDPTIEASPIQKLKKVTEVKLKLSDHPVIIELL